MIRITAAAVVLALSVVTAVSAVSGDGSPVLARRSTDYRLMLESRRFVPEPGLPRVLPAPADADGVTHMIVQFDRLPDASDIELLRLCGITLLNYLPNLAYFASVPRGGLVELAALPCVRAVIAIRPEDRLASRIRDGAAPAYARDEDGTVRVVVVFFGDIDTEDAARTARKYGRITTIRGRDLR